MFSFRRKKIQATLTEKNLGSSRSPWVAGTSKKLCSKFPASTPRLLTRESSLASQLSAWKLNVQAVQSLGETSCSIFKQGRI